MCFAKDKISPRLDCKNAVKIDPIKKQNNHLEQFPVDLDCQSK